MWRLLDFFQFIIISSVTSSILICIILFVKRIFKNTLSANWHFYIWLIVLVRLMIPYVPESSVSVFNLAPVMANLLGNQGNTPVEIKSNLDHQDQSKPQNAKAVEGATVEQNLEAQSKNIQFTDKKHNGFNEIHELISKFIILWLAGVLIFGVYIAFINLRLLFKIRRSDRLNNESTNRIFNECKSILKINNGVSIMVTTAVNVPSLYGLVKPRLLMPKNTLENVNNCELKHIFLHELSHLKRKDNVINWLLILLKALHWFNPLIWYAFYIIHQDCEIACDALALSVMNHEEKVQYGYTIIHLLKISSGSHYMPGTVGILDGKSQLRRRIIMISLFNKKSFKWSAAGVLILVVLSFMLLTNPRNSSALTHNTIQTDTKITASLNNADINKENELKEKRPITIQDIKGSFFKGKLMIISDPSKITLAYSLKEDKTVSEMAKEANAIGAINAGGFKPQSIDSSAISPYGFIIKDGKVVYDELNNYEIKQDTVGFTYKDQLLVGKFTLSQLKKYGIKDAVCFGPAIIINGSPMIKEGDGGWGIAPRTAIGQKSDGTVLFLVIDGRSVASIGATLKDVQNIFIKNGVLNASLLDGGSSTTMYYSGSIINHPSSKGERSIASSFLALP
ncbi:MAG: M56 family metallopeptidase [Bacillota bacterium]|nr:M56 family metallopeptidase [Bacillota bacterium]